MPTVQLWHGIVLVDGEPIIFNASACRPPRICVGIVECFGDIGLLTDVYTSRLNPLPFPGWACLHPLLASNA